jgi:hypothetical protein
MVLSSGCSSLVSCYKGVYAVLTGCSVTLCSPVTLPQALLTAAGGSTEDASSSALTAAAGSSSSSSNVLQRIPAWLRSCRQDLEKGLSRVAAGTAAPAEAVGLWTALAQV